MKSAARAISSGFAKRRNGMVETILSLTFGGMVATMRVSQNPGAMPATRICVAREFLGPGHRHGGDAGLGGGVVGLSDIAGARNAGNVDDHAAAAALDHVHGGLARAQEDASEVNRDHLWNSASDIFLCTLPSAAFTKRASLVMPALLIRPSTLPKSRGRY